MGKLDEALAPYISAMADEQWVLAIDPGDVHVGMALMDAVKKECLWAIETTPEGCIDLVEQNLAAGTLAEVVVETFTLYPWSATSQAWSQMLTCELIGVIKRECRRVGMVAHMQGADIKKPTQKILRARGIRSVAKRDKTGGHAFDAELHGYRRVLRDYDQQGKRNT